MKRLILLLLISFVAFGVSAQEIERPSSSTYYTFSKNDQRINYSYWDYTGTSTDLLIETTSDTIDIRYHVKKHTPYHAKVISKFNPITLADTTVVIELLGRNSTDESWTSIASATSDAVSTDGIVKTLNSSTSPTYVATIAAFDVPFTNPTAGTADTLEYPQQTLSFVETSTNVEYSYLLVRYIISGDDATGTGIELVRSELKLFEL